MIQNILITIGIIAQIAGLTLPAAIEDQHYRYVVPTVVEESTAQPASADAFQWRLKDRIRSTLALPIKMDDDHGPQLDAYSALVMDAATHTVLWQKNPDDRVSIASITKLMTALVWFDHAPQDGLDHVHTLAAGESVPGGKELRLPVGEKLRAFDLLRSTIVGSDNDTALALAHSTEISDDAFVALMNAKATALGMRHTTFTEPTGIDNENRSTPYDIALLAQAAFRNPDIQTPAQMREHLQETVDTHQFTRVLTTDKLLYDSTLDVVGAKTGFTNEAGYCVVAQLRIPNVARDLIIVILGAPTDQGRFDEAAELYQWTLDHYRFPDIR